MTFLPIVDRELRVAARLPATFRNRTLAAGTVAAVAFLMLLFASVTGSGSFIGGTCFHVLAWLTLGFCLLEGVRKTADCLSEEKREGTLGLLFLTDLKGYDVVLGKLAATSLSSLYGLLAILPVLALPMLVGGVTPGEYWRVVLALLNILFLSLCAGMCISSRSLRQQPAMGGTLLLIVLISAIPLLTFTRAFYPFSPLYGFQSAFAGNYLTEHTGYWESLGLTLFWSGLLLVWASVAVPRSWQDNESGARWRGAPRARRYWGFGRMQSRGEMLAVNPIYWLASREQAPTSALNLCFVIALAGTVAFAAVAKVEFLAVYVPCALLLNFFLKVLLATQTTRFFEEARRENALEMLLATPLTVDQIVSGQILALQRIFLAPVISILLLEFGGVLLGMLLASFRGQGEQASDQLGGIVLGTLLYLTLFSADAAAVMWAGMWFGLTSRKESQASTKTVWWVLVAPLVVLVFWCPGLILFLGVPVFWMTWARSNLYSKLRQMAGHRYALLPVMMYPQPAPNSNPPRIAPPIINP